MICSNCGYRNEARDTICAQCGTQLSRPLRSCANGHETYEALNFCAECGAPMRIMRTQQELHRGANDRRVSGLRDAPRHHPGEEAIKERLDSKRRRVFAIAFTIVVVIGLTIGVLRVQERNSLLARQAEISQQVLLLPPPVQNLSLIAASNVNVFTVGPGRQWALVTVKPSKGHPLTVYAHYVAGIWQFIKGEGAFGQRCPTTVVPSSICQRFNG